MIENNKTLVLIPSSIFVEKELELDVGKIPPVLIPINGKALLELILESYKDYNADFFIITNEGKEMIKNYVSKRKEKVHLIEVANYGLGRTIKEALNKIPLSNYTNMIINFGDTLIGEIPFIDKDSIFYKELNESFRWTIFESENGRITKIIDKLKSDYSEKHPVIVGLFFIKNPSVFLECMNLNNEPELDLFYSSLFRYIAQREYDLIETNEWYDFGHIDNYYEAKKDFINKRVFNQIKIDKIKSVLEKRSKNIESFLNEIRWYLELPSQLRCFAPQVFDYSLDRLDPFLKMEYYGYPSVGDIYLSNKHNLGIWNHIFNSIFSVIDEAGKYRINETRQTINKALEEVYCQKTFDRVSTIKKDPRFNIFFNSPLVINSKNYESLNYYLDYIPKLFDLLIKNTLDSLNIIHGDLCLANILYDFKNRIIKLVDPRGRFGDFTLYGDYRYELAKLSHSFNGNYEFIINDNFNISINGGNIDYSFDKNEKHNVIAQMFNKRYYEKFKSDVDAVNFIESLLFISMVPLHSDFFERQVLMLVQGIEKLDKLIKDKQNLLIKKGMNIVIPIAGKGSRFLNEIYRNKEYSKPKPLINVAGEPMIKWALRSYPLNGDENLIFIIRKEHLIENNIDEKLKNLFGENIKIVVQNVPPQGAAHSVLLAKKHIDNEEPLLIIDSDIYFDGKSHFKEIQNNSHFDGLIPSFFSEETRFSFAKTDEDGRLIMTAEKIPISNNALLGSYYFKEGKDFVESAEEMIKNNKRANNEFYISLVYNSLIKKGKKIYLSRPKFIHNLGDPENLENFLESIRKKEIILE